MTVLFFLLLILIVLGGAMKGVEGIVVILLVWCGVWLCDIGVTLTAFVAEQLKKLEREDSNGV